jgi:uncharacterized membrane protein
MENTFFGAVALVGFVFGFAGLVMTLLPPKKINQLYGYRTSGSMRTQERWNFAQAYSSRLMMLCGVTLLAVAGILVLFSVPEKYEMWVMLSSLFVVIVMLFYKTENELKKRFSEN